MMNTRLAAILITLTCVAFSCKKGDAVTTPDGTRPDHVAAYASTDNRLLIGVCYYPWYTDGNHWAGDNLRHKLVPAQPPTLGKYDCAQQSVISQHVRWSVQGGIDFWISSWWGQGSSTDNVVVNAQLANPDFKSTMGYCLLYEPRTGTPLTVDNAYIGRFETDLRYMMTAHFNKPNYLKIDGKPVLYIYLTRTMQGDCRTLFVHADSVLQSGGFPGLYVVGDEVYWGQFSDARAQYMEAVTAYNPHISQTWVVDPAQFISRTVTELYNPWMTTANARGKSFWLDVLPGFNDLGVRKDVQHPVIPRRDTTTFASFLAAVKPVLKSQTVPLKVLVITSWNEWHEDTQIEPTIVTTVPTQLPADLTKGFWYDGYGTHYLDLLASFKNGF